MNVLVMRRPWQVWTTFVVCVVIAIYAVGRLSYNAIVFSRAESRGRQRAIVEENARLALWRLDSAMARMVTEESVRPYFWYAPFYSPSGVVPSTDSPIRPKELRPSPLLSAMSPSVRVYFQFDSAGRLSSPQAPGGAFRELAVPRYVSPEKIGEIEAQLAFLQEHTSRDDLLLRAPSFLPTKRGPVAAAKERTQLTDQAPTAVQQMQRGANEFEARSQNVLQYNAIETLLTPANVKVSVMKPTWVGGELLLIRRVIRNEEHFVQGCVLDWSKIKEPLKQFIADLLPNADLVPVTSLGDAAGERQLAALPVMLIPGSLPMPAEEGWSPLRWALVGTWACLMVAAIAVAVLLQGVVSLSERRAAFVSAVTHELRTPLTTFRMYAEMLAEGMVRDESTRRRYLETLRLEADRLTHLVENVLAYARLERNRPGGRIEPISVGRLIDRTRERLEQRAHEVQLELHVDASGEVLEQLALADPAAVEQILFNLVDNACKYAAAASLATLHLEAVATDRRVELKVRDHGPGISAKDQRKLFQAFRKSANEAARSAPGVGLGLALSRRLARDMNGDLRYEGTADGACFVLSLPVANKSATSAEATPPVPTVGVRA